MNGKFTSIDRKPTFQRLLKEREEKLAWLPGFVVHLNHLRQISPLAMSYLPMKKLCIYIYQLGPKDF